MAGDSADGPAAGSVSAWVVEHHEAVYRYAWRLTGSAADAEDLTQQVFLAVQAQAAQLSEVRSPRAWLLTILRHAYLKGRRAKRPVPLTALEVDPDSIPAQMPADSEWDFERLQAALDELPDEFKLVLLLFYFEQCSYQEIAERLRLPLGTVMSRLSRAKGHLRVRLLEKSLHRTAH